MFSQSSFFSQQEEQDLATLVNIIKSGSQQEKEEISKQLIDADRFLLLKYSRNPVFNHFCQQEDFPHFKGWSQWLKSKGYPWYKLTADGKDISVFDLYLGAYLFVEKYQGQHQETKESDESNQSLGWLDAACDRGLFYALETRCNLYKNKLKSDRDKPDTEKVDINEKVILIKLILENLTKLGKYYLSFGYLHSTFFLLDIGNYCTKLNKDDPLSLWGAKFHLAAGENFYCALELEKSKQMEEFKDSPVLTNDEILINLISKGAGLALFKTSWEKAEEKILTAINDSQSAKNIRDIATQKIDQLLRSNQNVTRLDF